MWPLNTQLRFVPRACGCLGIFQPQVHSLGSMLTLLQGQHARLFLILSVSGQTEKCMILPADGIARLLRVSTPRGVVAFTVAPAPSSKDYMLVADVVKGRSLRIWAPVLSYTFSSTTKH